MLNTSVSFKIYLVIILTESFSGYRYQVDSLFLSPVTLIMAGFCFS